MYIAFLKTFTIHINAFSLNALLYIAFLKTFTIHINAFTFSRKDYIDSLSYTSPFDFRQPMFLPHNKDASGDIVAKIEHSIQPVFAIQLKYLN